MNFCYGDVMLSLTYQPQDRCDVSMRVNQDKVSNRPISEDESLTDGTVSEEDEMYGMQDIVEDRIHDFKRTHFNSAVQCNFCRKKIWLKDAYQCGECGIVCHKKCMVRCGDETICDISGLRYRDASKNDSQEPVETKETPEIITTVASGSGGDNGSPGNTPPVSPHSQRRTLSSLFAQVASASKGSLKRAGSANNLAPPNSSHDGTHSRSLPHPLPIHPSKVEIQLRRSFISSLLRETLTESQENQIIRQDLTESLPRLPYFSREFSDEEFGVLSLAREKLLNVVTDINLSVEAFKMGDLLDYCNEMCNFQEGLITWTCKLSNKYGMETLERFLVSEKEEKGEKGEKYTKEAALDITAKNDNENKENTYIY
ncbi:formin-E-like [Palaemon carinicauda]|uniref:formin-E-like n=1 Tax=Palaemon carinicauda TaxID=392227 RepID=UPI0035B57F01